MTEIFITQADITTLPVDAIVNSANPRLTPGGGLSGYIHQQAGPDLAKYTHQLLQERKQNFLDISEPVITPGFKLPQYIIHVVGPKYHLHPNDWQKLLAKVYIACLDLAIKEGIKSIAFPSISTGIYGCPIEEAVPIVHETVSTRLDEIPDSLDKITFCCFDEKTFILYREYFSI